MMVQTITGEVFRLTFNGESITVQRRDGAKMSAMGVVAMVTRKGELVHDEDADRRGHFDNSVKWLRESDGELVGLSRNDRVSIRIRPEWICEGMVLKNTRGFESAPIAKIVDELTMRALPAPSPDKSVKVPTY